MNTLHLLLLATSIPIGWMQPDEMLLKDIKEYKIYVQKDPSLDLFLIGKTTDTNYVLQLNPGLYQVGIQTVATNGSEAEIVFLTKFDIKPRQEVVIEGTLQEMDSLGNKGKEVVKLTIIQPVMLNTNKFYSLQMLVHTNSISQ